MHGNVWRYLIRTYGARVSPWIPSCDYTMCILSHSCYIEPKRGLSHWQCRRSYINQSSRIILSDLNNRATSKPLWRLRQILLLTSGVSDAFSRFHGRRISQTRRFWKEPDGNQFPIWLYRTSSAQYWIFVAKSNSKFVYDYLNVIAIWKGQIIQLMPIHINRWQGTDSGHYPTDHRQIQRINSWRTCTQIK